MSAFTKVKCSEIIEGIQYSEPVFFDDGKNMFLAARKPAKHYHIQAIKNWDIPFLLTQGHKLTDEEVVNYVPPERDENIDYIDDVDDLEAVDDLEPLD